MGAPRRLRVDETFFEEINTEEKAYVLGLLYADGYNNVKGNSFVIALRASDIDILRKMRQALGSDAVIRHFVAGNPKKREYASLQICSKKMCRDLVTAGCMQTKGDLIRFPRFLDKSLWRHFVRGYFDGDGGLSTQRTVGTLSYRANIVSNPMFVSDLNGVFKEVFGREYYILRYRKHLKTEQIRIEGNSEALRFLHWIYADSKIYLKRKFDLYERAVSRRNEWQRKIEVFDANDDKSLGVFNSFKEAATVIGCHPSTLVKLYHGKAKSRRFRLRDLGRPLASDCTLAKRYIGDNMVKVDTPSQAT